MGNTRRSPLAKAVEEVLNNEDTQDLEILKTLRSIALEIAREGNATVLENFDECLYLARVLPSKFWIDQEHPSHEEWLEKIKADLKELNLRQTGSIESVGRELEDSDQWLDNPEILFFAILTKGMDSIVNVYQELKKSEDPTHLKNLVKEYFKE